MVHIISFVVVRDVSEIRAPLKPLIWTKMKISTATRHAQLWEQLVRKCAAAGEIVRAIGTARRQLYYLYHDDVTAIADQADLDLALELVAMPPASSLRLFVVLGSE